MEHSSFYPKASSSVRPLGSLQTTSMNGDDPVRLQMNETPNTNNGPTHRNVNQEPRSAGTVTVHTNNNTAPQSCCGGVCEICLMLISVLLFIVTLPFSLFLTIKVVQEYERAVIFRVGRLVTGGAKGPGMFFILPCIDRYRCIDLRTKSWDIPPQEILTRDSLTVAVDGVLYYRVVDACMAINNIEDFQRSTLLLAATTLRTVLGTKSLSEILAEREHISQNIGQILDEATDQWGVKVERLELKDVRLPVGMQRAMAAEAEANREARAKVVSAEGEQKASKALKEAAEVLGGTPAALQLRYLQTLSTIAAEKNSTIVFPLPVELLVAWQKK